MNKKFIHTKPFKRLMWLISILCITVLLVAAMRSSSKAMCKNIDVQIFDNNQKQFINEKMILQLLNAYDIINKKTKNEIDLAQLEKKLTSNVWIKKADVFFSNQHTLAIQITQRTPLYRLFTLTNQSFYLDEDNRLLPINNDFNVRIPVFTGYKYKLSNTQKDSASLSSILAMAKFINNDVFWNAQIQQVACVNNMFEIVPTVGDHIILFGDTVQLEEKFKKLKKYYDKVATQIGFDKYKYLNVQFNSQIVASNNYVNILDSVAARISIQQFLYNNNDTLLLNTDTVNTNRLNDTAVLSTVASPVRQAATNNNNTTRRQSVTPLRNVPRAATPAQRTPTTTAPARQNATPRSTNNNRNRSNQHLNNNRN